MSSRRPMVDGEYDPVAAAANRAAASKRAAQKQETDKLQREAEAKKAAEQEAARIAQIKAEQARIAKQLKAQKEAAAQKAAQEKAAQKAKDAAQRAQDAAKKTKTSGDGSLLTQFMETSRKTAKTITAPGAPTKAVIAAALDTWADYSDDLYAKGNFLTVKEQAKWLNEVKDNPFLALSGKQKPPKTFEEALARLQYGVSMITLGGAREETLPFSTKAGEPRREQDVVLQVIGGLIVFSPADYLVSNAFKALVGLGVKGQRILRKISQGASLTADEARQFEKLVGQYGYSTSDLRKASTKLSKLSNAEWDELLKKYQKYYDFWEETPGLYGAGAAYDASQLQKLEDVLDDLGYDADEYIDYLKKFKLGPTLNPATIAAFLNGVKPPKPDDKAYQKIESDLERYRESLREAAEEAVITGPVSRTGPKQPDPTKPGYTPPPEVTKEEEKGGTLPGYTPPPKEEEEPPKPIPPKVIEEEPPKPIPPKVIEEEPPKPIPPKVDEEEPPPPQPPDEPTPPPRIVPKKGQMKPNVFRALVGGMKEGYRVVFDYPKGPGETFTVTARSFPQALTQAQGLRRVKRWVPSEVDIAKTRIPTKK